jgi:hypothetical protein
VVEIEYLACKVRCESPLLYDFNECSDCRELTIKLGTYADWWWVNKCPNHKEK